MPRPQDKLQKQPAWMRRGPESEGLLIWRTVEADDRTSYGLETRHNSKGEVHLLFFIHLYVHCVCACVCMCAFMWRPETDVTCLSSISHHISFRDDATHWIRSSIWLGQLAIELQGSAWLAVLLPKVGVTSICHHAWLFTWDLGTQTQVPVLSW